MQVAAPIQAVGESSGQGLFQTHRVTRAVRVLAWSDAGSTCLILFSRMMHWAGRIEKELDKVLQHVTGTQQMRSVS